MSIVSYKSVPSAALDAWVREVIQWHQQEQLSWDEIGRRLECTADAARKLWGRAIKKLCAELGAIAGSEDTGQ